MLSSSSARSFASIAILSTTIGLLSAPAGAQTSRRVEDPAERARLVAEAQTLVDQASESYRAGEYVAALRALRTAEGLAERANDPSLANIRFNIARCLEQLDRPSEALEAYRRYDMLPDAPHRKEKAFAAMRALEKRVFAALAVACAPAGAVVAVEGLGDGAARPCPWQSDRVPPGSYEVVVTAPGHDPARQSVTMVAGDVRSLQITLVPSPGAPGPALGVAEQRPGRPISPWPWAAIGGGAAALGAGAAFTFLAVDRRDQAEELAPSAERDGAVSDFDTFRTLSYVSYGVGAALAITGVVLLFVGGDDDSDARSTRVVPGPNGLLVRF